MIRAMRATKFFLIAGVLALGTARADLASTDWMNAGGYGNLFTLLADDMPPEARANAELFADLWRKHTGQEIQLGPSNEYGLLNVALGGEGLSEDVLPPGGLASVGSDGFFLNTYTPSPRYVPFGAKKQLVIAGNSPDTTRAGIYAFFRRAFGSEWPAPGLPSLQRAGFRLEKRKEALAPVFAFREVGFTTAGTPEEAEFRLANGLRRQVTTPGLGRASAFSLAPPEAHLAANSRYFAEHNGQRNAALEEWKSGGPHAPSVGDLCPSAEGLDEVIASAIMECRNAPADSADPLLTLRRARAGWMATEGIWALTPMRPGNPCECAACRAASDREGTAIAPWLALANAVARQLNKDAPEPPLRILLHAAGPHLAPPKSLDADEHIVVMLFTDDCDFATPLAARQSAGNMAFTTALKGWANRARHLWVADHLTAHSAAPVPFPAHRVLQDNLRLYAEHHVEGVYLQATGPFPANDDFSALKYFLAARLLFNPDEDTAALQARFLQAAYGDAAADVRAYLYALQPLPGLSPAASAQAPLLEARAAAQAQLAARLPALAPEITARLKPLLP